MSKIEELEKKCKELSEEIERLKNEGKVWKPKDDEQYFVIRTDGNADYSYWTNDSYDNTRYQLGNCFKTREEAQAVSEKIKVYTELKRLAEEINPIPVDWDNKNQNKYHIIYNNGEKRLDFNFVSRVQMIGTVYSTNPKFLEIAKERIGKDKLLKLFKED